LTILKVSVKGPSSSKTLLNDRLLANMSLGLRCTPALLQIKLSGMSGEELSNFNFMGSVDSRAVVAFVSEPKSKEVRIAWYRLLWEIETWRSKESVFGSLSGL
jgi:hypothetical protein